MFCIFFHSDKNSWKIKHKKGSWSIKNNIYILKARKLSRNAKKLAGLEPLDCLALDKEVGRARIQTPWIMALQLSIFKLRSRVGPFGCEKVWKRSETMSGSIIHVKL